MPSSGSAPPAARRSDVVTAALAAVLLLVAVVFAASASWYGVFKAVHVVFAVLWVGGGLLLTLLGLLAQRRQDPLELATIARQAALVGERVFAPASIVVLLAGIAMMIEGDLDWGSFWVVFALLGFAATFVTGIGFLSPRAKRIAELLETKGAEDTETQAAIQQILLVARVDVVVLVLVVLDMTLKPFA